MSHGHHDHAHGSNGQTDAWHSHAGEAPAQAAHSEDVNVPMVIAYGTACFAAVIAVIILTAIYYFWYVNSVKIAREEQVDGGPTATSVLQNEYLQARRGIEEVDFKQPGWSDAERNLVRIPIDLAMKKVVEQYGKRAR